MQIAKNTNFHDLTGDMMHSAARSLALREIVNCPDGPLAQRLGPEFRAFLQDPIRRRLLDHLRGAATTKTGTDYNFHEPTPPLIFIYTNVHVLLCLC